LGENELKTTIALKGIGVSPGIVIGGVYVLNRQDVKETLHKLTTGGSVSREIKRFRRALGDSRQELLEIKRILVIARGSNLYLSISISCYSMTGPLSMMSLGT